MDQLIDLSTPRVHKSYRTDFTPTLARALGESFKRRRQSLLPKDANAKSFSKWEEQLTSVQEDSDLSVMSPVLATSPYFKHRPKPGPVTKTTKLVKPEDYLNIDLNDSNDSHPNIVGPVLTSSDVASGAMKQAEQYPEFAKTVTPIKTRKRVREGTPASLIRRATKRKTVALEHQSTPKPSPMVWTTENVFPHIEDPGSDSDVSLDESSSPVSTPQSVKQMRQFLIRIHGGGGKHKLHPLRNEVFSRYPELDDDPDQDYDTIPSCDGLEPNDDNQLNQLLAGREISHLKSMVEFLELEKQFGV